MKIVLVHDWLITQGGSEKVLEALVSLFQAPIYTLFHSKKTLNNPFLSSQKIHCSFLQKIPFATKLHRFLLPLFPYAIEKFDLSFADVIISSSHAVAKGVKKRKGQIHICYCHTPMRYAWDLKKEYLNTLPLLTRKLADLLLNRLQKWDQKNSIDVDLFIANSLHVANRISTHYGKVAKVVYPPVSVEDFFTSKEKNTYYITHCRLVPYKKVDLLLKTFANMPKRKLLIIGEGPERENLEKIKTSNVEFLGFVSQKELSSLLAHAKAYLFAAEEDFGIGVIEAQASGLPVIAWKKGGALETVCEGKTGLFFTESTPKNLEETINKFEEIEKEFDSAYIRNHSLQYNKERFLSDILKILESI
jgi:glycosyltransferase involved in cell wall biosynthesis